MVKGEPIMDDQNSVTQATPVIELTGTKLSEVLQSALQKVGPLEQVIEQMTLASNRARALRAQDLRPLSGGKKFGYWFGFFMLFGLVALIIGYGSGDPETVGGIVSLFAFVLPFVIVWRINKKKKRAIAECDATVQACESEMQALNRQYDQLYQQSYTAFEAIPEDYVNSLALETMLRFIANGRADTWKVCVDMFEEQKHRWLLENNSAESLALQQRQLWETERTRINSEATAVFTGITAAATVANYYQNKK